MGIDIYTSEGRAMFRILKHALGVESENPGYRNRFVATIGTVMDFHCQRLVDLGAMTKTREEPGNPENAGEPGYRSYKVTVSGCIVAGLTVEQIEKACEG